MTAGGLFSNYEASLLCDLSLQEEADKAVHDQVTAWFETLIADENVCKLLDQQLLEDLLADSRYHIGDEDKPNRKRSDSSEDDGVTEDILGASIFGASSLPKQGMAPAINRSSRSRIVLPPTVNVPSDITDEAKQEDERLFVDGLVWRKQMSSSDAQHLRTSNSKRTGNLRLARGEVNDIDQKSFFREVMFGDAAWSATQTARGIKEEAIIPFEVVIDATDHGYINLKIDHAEYRIARQANIPTWLHWGALSSVLRATNYTGAWVIIERRTDGTYKLEITRTG